LRLFIFLILSLFFWTVGCTDQKPTQNKSTPESTNKADPIYGKWRGFIGENEFTFDLKANDSVLMTAVFISAGDTTDIEYDEGTFSNTPTVLTASTFHYEVPPPTASQKANLQTQIFDYTISGDKLTLVDAANSITIVLTKQEDY